MAADPRPVVHTPTSHYLGETAAAALMVTLPTGEMVAFPVDEWTLAHIPVALHLYLHGRRGQLQGLPERLPEFARWATHVVQARQGSSSVVHSVDELQDAGMRPIPFVLTYEEVGEVLRCSAETVARTVKSGDLKAFRIGKSPRIHRDDLVAYIDQLRTEDAAA